MLAKENSAWQDTGCGKGNGLGRDGAGRWHCGLQLLLQEMAISNGGRWCSGAFHQHQKWGQQEQCRWAYQQLLSDHRRVVKRDPDGRREGAPGCEAQKERAAETALWCPTIWHIE